MTPEEISEEIDVLVRMKMLGEILLGRAFFDTLSYVQIQRKLDELKAIKFEKKLYPELKSKESAEMRAA